MRNRDYIRLARLSLRSTWKTTLQTVLGISFGLVLLFPLLFIAIGFYGGVDAELNNDTTYRTQCITYSDVQTVNGKVLCNEVYEKNLNKLYGVEHNIKYDYCYLYNRRGVGMYFSINNGEKFRSIEPKNDLSADRFLGLEILDESCGNRPFLDADNHVIGKPLVAGRTFSTGKRSKGEIMVSTLFLKDYNLNAKQIIGSTLSVYDHLYTTKQNFSNSEEEIVKDESFYKNHELIPYMINFKIVGVYNSEIYYRRSPRTKILKFNLASYDTGRDPHRDYFWMTTASLGNNGETIAPKRIIKERGTGDNIYYESWYYYSDSPTNLSQEVTSQGYAFLPFGLGVFNRGIFNSRYTKSQLLEFYNFQTARKAYDKIIDYYKKSVTGDPEDTDRYTYEKNIVPSRFDKYQSFYDRFIFICLGLGVFGGIIFAATLLNLINTMHYSVQSKKGFLGICRAEGMKRKGIRRLFLSQINIIFLRSYLAMILLGGGACIAIKILFDQQLSDMIFDDSRMDITLGWWYIPISMVIIIILTMIISLGISMALVRKVNRTPLLDILSEENKM